jgi:cephalosporin hydroxylase
MQSRDETITGLWSAARTTPSELNEHLDVLYRFASGCNVVCEFGVADCTTTAAFLFARPKELHSYDIRRQDAVDRVERIAKAEGQHFEFHHASTLEVEIPECDMLYVDDLHTYSHVKAELQKHAGKVRKYLAFHDTECCRDQSEDATRPGIWQAIAEFLREHPEWRIVYTTEDYAGLAILGRVA